MKIVSRPQGKAGRFAGRLLATAMAVWMAGAAYTPALAATTSDTVTVDQAPLIVQASLPPNIMLMLDDSGSMAWDFMPDWSYLDTSSSGLVDASNNYVYYNPAVTYSPPPKADSTTTSVDDYTSYGDITSVPEDGFASSLSKKDLTDYSSSYIDYSATYPAASTKTYSSVSESTCKSYVSSSTYSSYSNVTYSWSKSNGGGGGYGGGYGGGSTSSTGTCTITYYTSAPTYYFRYATGDAGGTYTLHYVAASDCGSLDTTTTPTCVVASDTSGAAAPSGVAAGTNIANWFAYYHTRILMAKSGLMSAFSTLNADYRFGFGSINGNYDSGLPSPTASFGSSSNEIAEVQVFGDGSSGTQKAKFWSWIVGSNAYNGTPLRRSLDAVGQYYQTSQPWTSMSSDPDDAQSSSTPLACRQSYTILTTDGFWNGSTPSDIGDQDGTDGPTVDGPNEQTYTYTPALPYTDSTISTSTSTVDSTCSNGYTKTEQSGYYWCVRSGHSNRTPTCSSNGTLSTDQGTCTVVTTTGSSYSDTLADVAMKYWKTDLQSDIDNEVPTNDEDPAFWQHMVTFTMGLGFTPEDSSGNQLDVDKIFSWANGKTSDAISDFSWPEPKSDSINNIADLAHAAVNGHGGFYSATSPAAFTEGLKDALNRASQRIGTGASLAANSTELETGTYAYQANYYTSTWKGDLKALVVDSTTGDIASTATWTAAGALPSAGARNIYTYNPDAASGSQYVAFSDPSKLSTDEQDALGDSTTNQQNMINYLRGDSSLEEGQTNGIYRTRATPLGDIVNSQPVYSGEASANQFSGETFTGSDKFATYATETQSRDAMIYVAANDGMLHAFAADDGTETFAYIPAAVITDSTGTTGTTDTDTSQYFGLSALASPDYGSDTVPHEFFNDGELTVADAYFAEGSSDAAWHTVLVGTTGRGQAKAVYALDVTDPTDIKFLWERSAGDGLTNSSYIGQLVGKPIVAQVGDGQWAVLMGNGYNSAAGTSALLQFDLASGTLSVHATTDTTTGNGLAAPAVWIGDSTNGISTMAYAGDLHGHVWSFPVSTTTTTTASDGTTTTTHTADTTSKGTLLFTTGDANGTVQPITAGMLIGRDSSTQNLWIFFGTGQYLSATDLTDTQIQAWYGLIVSSTADSTLVGKLTSAGNGVKNTNLVERSIIYEQAAQAADEDTGTAATLAARVVSEEVAGDMSGKSGWYMDLGGVTDSASSDDVGERMVTPNQFQGSLLVGTTRIPTATDPCNPSGSGWIMAVNPFTGTNPDPAFFDINGDGSINSSDTVTVDGKTYNVAGVGFSSLPNNPIFVGGNMLTSFDNGTTSSISTAGSGSNLQRVSWRELINQ